MVTIIGVATNQVTRFVNWLRMIIAPGPAWLRGIGAAENCPLYLFRIVRRLEGYQEETTMMKLSLIGVAAVAATAAFAVPAFAQHRTAPVNAYAQLDRCTHDAGNPFSKEEDYMAWSAWRARGGWDDRIDPNCLPSRSGRFGF